MLIKFIIIILIIIIILKIIIIIITIIITGNAWLFAQHDICLSSEKSTNFDKKYMKNYFNSIKEWQSWTTRYNMHIMYVQAHPMHDKETSPILVSSAGLENPGYPDASV